MTPETRKKTVLLTVLIVLLAGAGYYFYQNVFGPVPGATQGAAARRPSAGVEDEPAEPSADSRFLEEVQLSELLQNVREVSFDYNDSAGDMRNPMRPLVGMARMARGLLDGLDPGEGSAGRLQRTPFVLTAVVWSEDAPMAVIDNEVVSPGDELPNSGGIFVESINPAGVVLRFDDQTIPVELPSN